MTIHPAPVDVLVAFTQAWTGYDTKTTARFLADDVVYDGPVNRLSGAGACGERVTMRGGNIQTDLLAFDTFAIRTAQAARADSAWIDRPPKR